MPPAGFGPIVDGDGNPVYQMDEYGNVIYPDAQPNLPELPPEPVSRFTRQGLDPTGQKLYDQLAQQKQLLGENASQLYRPTSFINEDEQLALMAANLARTGITDIYKVKKVPVAKYLEKHINDEDGQPWYVDYTEYGQSQWYPPNDPRLRFDESGAYLGTDQYINTETGQPLNVSATNVFNNDSRILASEGTGGRSTAGFGVEFLENGIPVYFATGYDAPRKKNLWDFVKGVLPLAVQFIPGIGQLFAPIASSILGAGASQAAVAALSKGIAAAIAGTVATGDIEKGILSGLTSGILNYGGGIASGLDEVAYVAPTSASQLAAIGTGALPGMSDLAWMDTISPSQVAAAGIAALPEAGASLADVSLSAPAEQILASATESTDELLNLASQISQDLGLPIVAPPTELAQAATSAVAKSDLASLMSGEGGFAPEYGGGGDYYGGDVSAEELTETVSGEIPPSFEPEITSENLAIAEESIPPEVLDDIDSTLQATEAGQGEALKPVDEAVKTIADTPDIGDDLASVATITGEISDEATAGIPSTGDVVQQILDSTDMSDDKLMEVINQIEAENLGVAAGDLTDITDIIPSDLATGDVTVGEEVLAGSELTGAADAGLGGEIAGIEGGAPAKGGTGIEGLLEPEGTGVTEGTPTAEAAEVTDSSSTTPVFTGGEEFPEDIADIVESTAGFEPSEDITDITDVIPGDEGVTTGESDISGGGLEVSADGESGAASGDEGVDESSGTGESATDKPMTPEEVDAAFKEEGAGDPYIAGETATGGPMTPGEVEDALKGGGTGDPNIASETATGGPMTPEEVDEALKKGGTGDPNLAAEAGAGGGSGGAMPPEEVADALKKGGTGDPYIANEMAGATAMGTSTTPTLDIFKQILANPVGRTIVGQLLTGGIGGAGGVLNLLGGSGATAPGGIAGLAQQQAPQIYYADLPEFDVTKEFSPTLYAMREGRV